MACYTWDGNLFTIRVFSQPVRHDKAGGSAANHDVIILAAKRSTDSIRWDISTAGGAKQERQDEEHRSRRPYHVVGSNSELTLTEVKTGASGYSESVQSSPKGTDWRVLLAQLDPRVNLKFCCMSLT